MSSSVCSLVSFNLVGHSACQIRGERQQRNLSNWQNTYRFSVDVLSIGQWQVDQGPYDDVSRNGDSPVIRQLVLSIWVTSSSSYFSISAPSNPNL